MSQQILVRRAGKDDWKGVLKLYETLDEEDLEYRFFNIHHLSAEEARKISVSRDHMTFLAFSGDTTIAECTLQSDGEVSIVVSPDFRGHGVATHLFEYTLLAARERGMKRLHFFTLPSNSRMTGLGRALGFRLISHSVVEEEWVLDL
ncbi:MAG TPA: GNAT family N-acetyltransferase [Nitrososphaerales archaeon]|nr:GNAT family N-acetyltransferase [Nitrososphaerales archaeon]